MVDKTPSPQSKFGRGMAAAEEADRRRERLAELRSGGDLAAEQTGFKPPKAEGDESTEAEAPVDEQAPYVIAERRPFRENLMTDEFREAEAVVGGLAAAREQLKRSQGR